MPRSLFRQLPKSQSQFATVGSHENLGWGGKHEEGQEDQEERVKAAL